MFPFVELTLEGTCLVLSLLTIYMGESPLFLPALNPFMVRDGEKCAYELKANFTI